MLELVILAAIVVASSLLILFVPPSRVYCSIALVLVIIYGLRLWRILPSDRRRVAREAHRQADAMMMAQRAAAGSSLATRSEGLASPPAVPVTQFAPNVQHQFMQTAAAPTQQLLATSVAPPYETKRAIMLNSMMPPPQQAMMNVVLSPQHVLLASSMMQSRPTSLVSTQTFPVPQDLLPKVQHVGDTGNVLPQQLLNSGRLAQFG
ncbi:hypothetical protein TraAM80_01615 [Trypanosoma rangeli]|uniref:Uncharacterized protein n=1 Tax=Trypanosoma rangeli TaxID=5698 RepID=A0A422NXK6_TRYRA|nr:uncharacterized protein TraAM80_01615 [Trypanosoma rangeli]RNF10272.1 hypothetical protein TraAM80_01615 [Trypanosoma rangeli]|eukprot:RNF10272.1 hypothetical protein TraAM80_01615 [Trypanosoma rangeli]